MDIDSETSEQRVEAAYRAAVEGMTPEYVAILRRLEPGVRINQGFMLWRLARDALIRQEMDRGVAFEAAARLAARRMLELADAPTP